MTESRDSTADAWPMRMSRARSVASSCQSSMSAPSGLGDFRAEEDHVAVEIGNIEVPQTVVLIGRRLDHFRTALRQVSVQRIDIVDEDAGRAVTRLSRSLGCGDQMQGDVTAAQANVECRRAVFE